MREPAWRDRLGAAWDASGWLFLVPPTLGLALIPYAYGYRLALRWRLERPR